LKESNTLIEQGYFNLIKSHSKYIYNVKKMYCRFHKKC